MTDPHSRDSSSTSPTATSSGSNSRAMELDAAFWDGVDRKDWQYHQDRASGFMPTSADVTREEMSIYTRQRIRQRETDAAERKAPGRETARREATQGPASRRRGSLPLRLSPLSKLSTLDFARDSNDNTPSKSGEGPSRQSSSSPVSPLASDEDLPPGIPKSLQVSPLSSEDESEAKNIPSPIRRRPAMRRRSVRDAYLDTEPAREGDNYPRAELPQINIERSETPEFETGIRASGYFSEEDRYGRPHTPSLSPAPPSRGSPSSQVFDMSPLGNELDLNRSSMNRSGRSYFPRLSPPSARASPPSARASPSPARGSPSSQVFEVSPFDNEIAPKRGSSGRRT